MSVQGLATTHKGMEDLLAKELKTTDATSITPDEECVIFTAQDLNHLCTILYTIRTATGMLWLLGQPEQAITNLDTEILKNKTFAVKGKNAPQLGELIQKKTGAQVNLTSPDITFTTHSTTKQDHFGIDLAGIDLGKRDYRIFLGPASIKGTLAQGLLQLADWKKEKTLLDPFCQAGIIPIEAALVMRNKPIAYHQKKKLACYSLIDQSIFEKVDKTIKQDEPAKIYAFDPHFKHISATQKNAKIAHVNKTITYSRQDIDWIDLKLEKNSIDCIATTTPPDRDLKKEDINNLFKRAKAILKKNGTLTILTKNKQQEITKAAKDWTLKEQRSIWQGQSEYTAYVYTQ